MYTHITTMNTSRPEAMNWRKIKGRGTREEMKKGKKENYAVIFKYNKYIGIK